MAQGRRDPQAGCAPGTLAVDTEARDQGAEGSDALISSCLPQHEGECSHWEHATAAAANMWQATGRR